MGAGKTADMTERQKANMKRVFAMPFATLHKCLLDKVERKGRSRAELDRTIEWLTGYDATGLGQSMQDGCSLEQFFAQAPAMNPNRELITGTICGVRLSEIDDPLTLKIRQLDKLVDELAQGRPMEKVLRG